MDFLGKSKTSSPSFMSPSFLPSFTFRHIPSFLSSFIQSYHLFPSLIAFPPLLHYPPPPPSSLTPPPWHAFSSFPFLPSFPSCLSFLPACLCWCKDVPVQNIQLPAFFPSFLLSPGGKNAYVWDSNAYDNDDDKVDYGKGEIKSAPDDKVDYGKGKIKSGSVTTKSNKVGSYKNVEK